MKKILDGFKDLFYHECEIPMGKPTYWKCLSNLLLTTISTSYRTAIATWHIAVMRVKQQ